VQLRPRPRRGHSEPAMKLVTAAAALTALRAQEVDDAVAERAIAKSEAQLSKRAA